MEKHIQSILYYGILIGILGLPGCNSSESTSSGTGNNNTTTPVSSPNPTLTIGMKQLQFNWPAITNADHYRLLTNPDGSSGFAVIPGAESITSTSHNLDVSVHDLNWISAQYRVEACNADDTTCLGSTSQTLTPADSISATGYFKASNPGSNDYFGFAIALSSDGTTMAVGAYWEDSSSTGINSTPNTGASSAGAAYVFEKTNGVWSQQAYIKPSNTGAGDSFGVSVALSSDGNTLAVGASNEASNTQGINTTPNDSGSLIGATYIFTRTNNTWSQDAYIKASNAGNSDYFGRAVALSNDGNTLAVGAYGEGSSSTGINSTPNDAAASSGAVYVYTRTNSTWLEQAYIKASNTWMGDHFGFTVALNGDGNTLAVGAHWRLSSTGAVYVFTRTGTSWSQQSYMTGTTTQAGDMFGYDVALNNDGNTLAVGAIGEDSSTSGINTTPDELATASGAVYLFSRVGSTWNETTYLKPSNTGPGDGFGSSVALTDDGNTLIVGAYLEDSSTSGINSTPDEGATDSGAAYAFRHIGGSWMESAYIKASNTGAGDYFGYKVIINGDGSSVAIGAHWEDSSSSGISSTPDDLKTNAGALYLY